MTPVGPPVSDRYPLVRLVLGAALISFSGVFVKLVTVGPTASAFWRTLLGGGMLCLWMLSRQRPIFTRGPSLKWLVAAGFVFAIDLFVWHKAILYVGVGLSTLLGNFQVFVMAAAAVVIFGERVHRAQLIAIPLAVLGLYLIVGIDWAELESTSKLGVFLGLATALVYTAFMLCLRQARWAQPQRDAAADLAVASLMAALFLAIIAAFTGETLMIHDASDWAWLSAYALVGQVLGWVLISSSLPFVPTVQIGLALLLQPTLAYVWDVVIFHRELAGSEMLGAAIAIFAIYLGSRVAEPDLKRKRVYNGSSQD